MKKIFLIFLLWLISTILIIIYVNENPENIEKIKNYFSKDKTPELILNDGGEIQRQPSNSFIIEFQKVVSLSEKTAFMVHDESIQDFDENSLKIYTQNGYVTNNLKFEKLNLPNVFTTEKNGGV